MRGSRKTNDSLGLIKVLRKKNEPAEIISLWARNDLLFVGYFDKDKRMFDQIKTHICLASPITQSLNSCI